MKNKLIWLRWKLFCPLKDYTCVHLNENYRGFPMFSSDYYLFLSSRFNIGPAPENTFALTKQKRREAMWRFLVKGERA